MLLTNNDDISFYKCDGGEPICLESGATRVIVCECVYLYIGM